MNVCVVLEMERKMVSREVCWVSHHIAGARLESISELLSHK